ncbi:MAG: GMC family oxidoreductase [Synechococcaceae bacterium WB4_1_0192]|jgi:choline dehydrogenase-like flavoprotein|nr:GMC family oxidoreductase [Synechococcaceae bacterium WB4_1_0192]
MIIDDQHYDVIVIGSGAAGGTLAGHLASAGKAVLLLERGGAMPLADQNVADVDLFRKDRYHPGEQWFGTDGDPFSPQTIYALGGNTKIWGAVLQRMREREFGPLALQEGPVPSWEIGYADLAPYYERAEELYRVHGQAGIDPTEPPRRGDYPFKPRPIEPFMQELRAALERCGNHPFDLPLSWSESTSDPTGDAELFGVEPARAAARVRIRERARVRRLHVNPTGREVRGVEAEIEGTSWLFSANAVVLAAGAINSAEILLRSATEHHSRGLANGSDQVGRNLMKHQLTSVIQLAAEPNSGRYGRSLGITDYYWGDSNVSVPLGAILSGGGVLQDALFAESPPVLSLVTKLLPSFGLEQLASRSVAWWASSAVRPDPHNRLTLRGNHLQIHYLPNNREAHDRLVYRWIDTLKQMEADPLCHVVKPAPTHPRGEAPLTVMGSVCGTCRMGSNPATSVVDLQGRCHELANLWIADASVFPSCPSVPIGLTVIANALRIGDQMLATL